MVDEEEEEIRIENKDEFDTNVKVNIFFFIIFFVNIKCQFYLQYARDHGLKSLPLIVYIDDKRQFDGIYHLEKSKKELPIIFPIDKLENLRDNILVDKWYIPVKLDEELGICLTSAIKLAQEGI